jgi:N-methylhydantoinase B
MRANDGSELVHIEPQHGGWGACRDRDGASGLISLTDGDTYNYSIELLEAKFPLLTERYGFNVEGGVGAGRFRGGYGLVREYRILSASAEGYCGLGRTRVPPWSMDGAAPSTMSRSCEATGSGCASAASLISIWPAGTSCAS